MQVAPPQLHFDDGSRIIVENQSSTNSKSSPNCALINPRGDTPVQTYYEIDRISNTIVNDHIPKILPSEIDRSEREIEFLCKVALQFPDELLVDSAEVAWLLEENIITRYEQILQLDTSLDDDARKQLLHKIPLVFILGDTTYASCCPDEIGAQHLNADLIVHFGQYACLSVSDSLPIIYSFGVTEWPQMKQCATAIINQSNEDNFEAKVILVSERRYHHYLEPLAELLHDNGLRNPIVGKIPVSDGNVSSKKNRQINLRSCCNPGMDTSDSAKNQCCKQAQECCSNEDDDESECSGNGLTTEIPSLETVPESTNGLIIGGLHISVLPASLSKYTLIFIGDDSGQAKSRQFLNTVLKCTSPESSTKACWSYNPSTEHLSTDPMSILGVSRHLNRRFYLTQKAQLANVIGIIVGTLSQDRFRSVVTSVRKKIEDSGRSSYTFVVGKVNVAKLANFAEIECFVLVACGETSILSDERDYHLPVITPSELEIALGEKEWGGAASCNTDFGDFLHGFSNCEDDQKDVDTYNDKNMISNKKGNDDVSNIDIYESSDDEPVYSMVSGTYVSKPASLKTQMKAKNIANKNNLESLPGQGQMTEYKSEAAEFWKSREYKGLEANIGRDIAQAATKGQTGIASDYGK